MANHPFHPSCDCGVPIAPVSVGLSATAGLRSLFSKHPQMRLSPVPALAGRLAIAAICFPSGFVCAWLFVLSLRDAPGAGVLMASVASSVLVPLIAFLASAITASRLPRVAAARAFPGRRQPGPSYSTEMSRG